MNGQERTDINVTEFDKALPDYIPSSDTRKPEEAEDAACKFTNGATTENGCKLKALFDGFVAKKAANNGAYRGDVYRMWGQFSKSGGKKDQHVTQEVLNSTADEMFGADAEGKAAFLKGFADADADRKSGVIDGKFDKNEFYQGITGEQKINKAAIKINRGNDLRSSYESIRDLAGKAASAEVVDEEIQSMWVLMDEAELVKNSEGENQEVTRGEVDAMASEMWSTKGLSKDAQAPLVKIQANFLKAFTRNDADDDNKNAFSFAEFKAALLDACLERF